jgi:hypothetical protein
MPINFETKANYAQPMDCFWRFDSHQVNKHGVSMILWLLLVPFSAIGQNVISLDANNGRVDSISLMMNEMAKCPFDLSIDSMGCVRFLAKYPDKKGKEWDKLRNCVLTYLWLERNRELIHFEDFLTHESPNVRCYAFFHYQKEASFESVVEVLVRHLQDTSTFFMRKSGSVIGDRVGNFFLELILTDKYFGYSTHLWQNRLHKEDGLYKYIIIFGNPLLKYRKNLLWNFTPDESFYKKIRQLVLQETDFDALVALATYQKEEDVDLINRFLFSSFMGRNENKLQAVINFPAEEFYPFVEKMYEEESFDDKRRESHFLLYEALSKYLTPNSLRLMEETVRISKEKNCVSNAIQFLWIALEKNPDSYFSNIKAEICLTKSTKEWLKRLYVN